MGNGRILRFVLRSLQGRAFRALLFEKMQQLWREMPLLRILRKILPIELTWRSQTANGDLQMLKESWAANGGEKTKSPLSLERAQSSKKYYRYLSREISGWTAGAGIVCAPSSGKSGSGVSSAIFNTWSMFSTK